MKYESNKTYTQVMELISGTIKDAEGNDFTNHSIMAKSGKWFINGKSDTFTLQEQSTGTGFWCNVAAIFNNAKIRIWGYEGTEDKPYEQYGASPSIDYPSEIKTVKDSVEVDVVNKNLFDKNKALRGYELNGTTGQTSSNSLFFTSDYIRVNPNGQYFLSGKHDGTSNCFYDKNKKYLGNVTLTNGLLTVPDNSDIYYLRINARLTSIDTTMIEKGTKKTDYVEGESQSVIMPIQQEMLEGDYIDKDGEHHEWGKLVLTGDEKDSVFEQKESATGLVYFRVDCDWKKQNGKVLSNMLKVSTKHLSEIEQNADLIYSIVSGNEFFIMLKDSSITSVALLKAKLKELNEAGTPLTIYYEIRKDKNTNIYGDAPKTRYLLNDEQNEALTTELNAYQNITNIDASNELASVDVTYYTNNKSNKIYVKEYELEKLDKQLGNEFQKLDSNIQKLEPATEYPNYFLRLISAKSTQKYTINSGEITQIQLEKFNYNGSFYGEFISVYSGMIDISRDIYLDISGAIKFYTSPKENCNISLCLLKYLYDNETESFSVKEELFSTDILKATTDSKVSAVIPSTIIYAQTNDIVGLGFKSNISGEYTIMQDPQNSFLKIRPISRIIQRPQ